MHPKLFDGRALCSPIPLSWLERVRQKGKERRGRKVGREEGVEDGNPQFFNVAAPLGP